MYNRYHRHGPGGWAHRGFFNQTPVNIEETAGAYTISLYAPALVKGNIQVSTQNDLLHVRYKPEERDSQTHYTRREYGDREISRSFELKGKVDTDKIRAVYAEGVLRIELPKTEAAKKPSQDVPVS
jgi:HSP20 family protein